MSLIWVRGTSMEPTLHAGDLAVVYARHAYAPGDVVAFEIPEGGIVIHRVIERTPAGYRFQGDNRARADPWVLTEDEIVGRAVVHVPAGARLLAVLARPLVLAVLSGLATLLWLLQRHEPSVEGARG